METHKKYVERAGYVPKLAEAKCDCSARLEQRRLRGEEEEEE